MRNAACVSVTHLLQDDQVIVLDGDVVVVCNAASGSFSSRLNRLQALTVPNDIAVAHSLPVCGLANLHALLSQARAPSRGAYAAIRSSRFSTFTNTASTTCWRIPPTRRSICLPASRTCCCWRGARTAATTAPTRRCGVPAQRTERAADRRSACISTGTPWSTACAS